LQYFRKALSFVRLILNGQVRQTGEKEVDIKDLYVKALGVSHLLHRFVVEGRLVRAALREYHEWEGPSLKGIAYELPLTGLKS
jgi:hypothetical protein